jgi:hypothetical protein
MAMCSFKPLVVLAAVKGCPLPMSPEHGRLSCETPGSGETTDISRSRDLLEEGSVCRYDCDPGYAVPPSQMHLAVIRCQSHSWNSTADPSCQGELLPTFISTRSFSAVSVIPMTLTQSYNHCFTTIQNIKVIVSYILIVISRLDMG